jgi:uncharacterized protein DUF839
MRSMLIVLTCTAGLAATAAAVGAQTTGPSSSQSPYVTPKAPGWSVVSLITAGDSPTTNPSYRMVGIPDGLGALRGKFEEGKYVADDAYMSVFMNHEIPAGSGIIRAHGANGAFVSRWTIHLNSLQVRNGEDLIQKVFAWDAATASYIYASPNTVFSRFCSADMPAETAFYDPWSGKGFRGGIFMNGEESGTEGRAWAHIVSGVEAGNTYQLPYLGRFSWENSVAHPDAGNKTIVMGNEDGTPGSVYMYIGDKRYDGNPVERAGLVGGALFGIKVTNGGVNYGGAAVTRENSGAIVSGTFVPAAVSAHANLAVGAGAALQADTLAAGVTEFARPEDGAWDPARPNVFYFVTTGANISGAVGPRAGWQWARLYKLTFADISTPAMGGTIELITDALSVPRIGGEVPPQVAMFDNIAVDGRGHVLIQEDPGGNNYLAKTWDVDPFTKTSVEIFESDSARFAPGGSVTIDEESSGIVEVTNIVKNARWFEHGRRYYLADMQAHNDLGAELYEGGQLYLLASPRVHQQEKDDDHDDHDDGHHGEREHDED